LALGFPVWFLKTVQSEACGFDGSGLFTPSSDEQEYIPNPIMKAIKMSVNRFMINVFKGGLIF
jgi:hypothetical protein